MDIIYKITFMDRVRNMTPPYYYIGSKSNCDIVDGVIVSSNGSEYWGSSRYSDYPFGSQGAVMEVLSDMTGAEYNELIQAEFDIQVENNVLKSEEYFNLSYATKNSFSEPGYATYRHKDNPNKMIRLKTDDELVESGEYVHINKDRAMSEDAIANWVGKVASKPKSDDHKAKLGRKGLIMLQNKDTLEIVRVPTDSNLDRSVWLNPKKIKPEDKFKCKHCDIVTIKANLKRWHNENCKFKDTGKHVAPSSVRTTNRKRIPVVINGVEYKSINAAALSLGVSKYEIKKLANI